MQYGSIGWSVGATLGYAQATPDKRVIACIGDGSFQVQMQGFLFQILKHCFTINNDRVPMSIRFEILNSFELSVLSKN
jgi:TPP-dependent 2-oxoacid decarboxylase